VKQRIIGIDVARALAVIGMIIVNFKVVLGSEGVPWVKTLAGIFDGKAAATFVVLAGVGLALMTSSALRANDPAKLRIAKKRILKRALFLFVIGLSYIAIWPADILHFYGVYMAITVLLLAGTEKMILITAILFVFAFPVLMLFWNYEAGWNFDTLDYHGFWTPGGFLRNLFFNGFHPVIPWTAFMLFGYWFGKQDLHNTAFVKKAFWVSTLLFIAIQVLSYFSIVLLADGNETTADELHLILGTDPMPPLPVYMFNGVTLAFAVISACILIAKRFANSALIDALNKTGQLALTFYVAHVVVGMGIIEVLFPGKAGNLSVSFSVLYAFGFSLCCILFALVWRKHKPSGPLEWIMRKVAN
jgi:uncharacterized protein